MKAAYYESNGDLDVIRYSEDFPKPDIKDNEVLVKVKATSINMIDTVMREGYPTLQISFPHIPGGDISGEVVEVGSGVSNFKSGDRIVSFPIILSDKENPKFAENPQLNFGWKFFGMQIPGGYAEYVAIPESSLYKIPDNVSYEKASTLPTAGLTAIHAIDTIANLQKGDTFLVWGGSGGLGSFAVQLAKQRGAIVLTTTSTEEKAEKLRQMGADYVYMRDDEQIVEKIKANFPGGLDAVLDYVGPTTFDKSFSLLRNDGRIMFCGMITGREVSVNIQQMYFRHLNINGLFLGNPKNMQDLIDLLAEGKIDPIIDTTYDISQAKEAQKHFESGDYIGKIVLTF
jgi:NADPH:quinone reductase-like Zn-dependent oxidoreductase